MRIFILCSAVWLAQSLVAAASTESKESVSFIFRMISWGAEPLPCIVLPIEGEMQRVYAPIDQRSEELHYRGPKELVFYNQAFGEAEGVSVAKVTANDQWREVLFLAQYNHATAKLNLLAFDDSEVAHPQNSIRLINLSGQPLGGLVGRQQVLLDDECDQTVPMKNKSGFIPLQFASRAEQGTGWQRFMSTAIEARPGARILLVFYPSSLDDPSGEREVSFKLYYDFPVREKYTRLN